MQVCRLLQAAGVEAVPSYEQISSSRLQGLRRQYGQYRQYQ